MGEDEVKKEDAPSPIQNGSNPKSTENNIQQAENSTGKKSPLEANFTPQPPRKHKRRRLSLSHREFPPPEAPTDTKSVMPQILACAAMSSINIPEGMALSYSSSLIPQLSAPNSEVKITLEQGVLLAGMMVVTMGLAAPLAGIIMNRFGRINAVRLSIIPYVVGWILVATAVNYEMILVGRLITGVSLALGVSSACVYNTEVAAPHIRGALNVSCPTLASLGIVITYVLGAYTTWRIHAWVGAASPIFTLISVQYFSYESPIWLVSKGRHQEAEKSLRALARYNNSVDAREKLPERQLAWLIQRHKYAESSVSQNQKKDPWYLVVSDLFRQPIGYKPLLILTFVFVAQNFSGVYITIFFAATFFQKMGSSIEYQAAIYIGLVRFIFGLVAIVLIRNFGVRPLMVFSSLGMALAMALSGYLTKDHSLGLGEWAATTAILIYVAFSCCGLQSIPWTMTAEVYPDHLRDVGNAVSVLAGYMLMFVGLQLYPTLEWALGGPANLQWFFAASALANVIFCLLFLPETHGRSLQEIEEHYEHNTLWIGRKKFAADIETASTTSSLPSMVVPTAPSATAAPAAPIAPTAPVAAGGA